MTRKQRKDKARVRQGPSNSALPRLAYSHQKLPRWLGAASVLILLALFAGLSIWEMSGDSTTIDERIHIPAGYAYWKDREFRLNPEHPPLVKLLASAPLLAMNLRTPPTKPDSSDINQDEYKAFDTYQTAFGSEFLFTQDADRILFWGRLPMVVLGLLLAFLVFWWSWKLHGDYGAGLVSLLLIALEPTIVAHSHYVTTDVAVSSFSVMTMFFLWSFSRDGKVLYLFFASLGLGLALAAKFSAIFLLPVFFFLLPFQWPSQGLQGLSFLGDPHSFRTRILTAACAGLIALITVQASYLFSPDLSLYLKGLRSVNANHLPNFFAYVNGSFVAGGVWWYALYAFLLKTPLPTIIAMILAGVFILKTRRSMPQGLSFALLPALVYTLAVCFFADNLGVRYMIPVTAFLLVVAGGCRSILTGSRGAKLFGAALALWLMVSVLRVSPHYIAYFNELTGGPENARYYLGDSNVDWGQDLERLMAYLRKNKIEEAILSFWGPSPPQYYGERYGIRLIPWTPDMAARPEPLPGVYAISLHNLMALQLSIYGFGEGGANMDWLTRFKPSDRVGYSIYIYKFPQDSK